MNARCACDGRATTGWPISSNAATKCDLVVRLGEFEGILLCLEEVISGIPALGGVLQPIVSDIKKTERAPQLLQRVGGIVREIWNGSVPHGVTGKEDAQPRETSTFSEVPLGGGRA